MANRVIIDDSESFIGINTGTEDRSAVSIIKAGDPDEQVASASWEAGNISEAFLEIYRCGMRNGLAAK